MTENPPEETFEDALSRLENLVKQLEDGDLKLEEALATFEQGIKLTRDCQQALQNAEQKVEILIEEQGSASTRPFPQHDPE